jgi:hypothetical protein
MELFKNKILIALYSIWFSFHFFTFLVGGDGETVDYYYENTDVRTNSIHYDAKDYFFNFGLNDKGYVFYDVSELFVYTVLPILLVLLFIAIFKRK